MTVFVDPPTGGLDDIIIATAFNLAVAMNDDLRFVSGQVYQLSVPMMWGEDKLPPAIRGDDTTFQAAKSFQVPMLTVRAPNKWWSNFVLEGIRFDCAGNAPTGLKVEAAQRSKFVRLTATRALSHGIVLYADDVVTGIYDCLFERMQSDLNGGSGFYVIDATYSVPPGARIAANSFISIGCNSNGGDGFTLVGQNDVFRDCHSEANKGYGFQIWNTIHTVLDGCWSEGCGNPDYSVNVGVNQTSGIISAGSHWAGIVDPGCRIIY